MQDRFLDQQNDQQPIVNVGVSVEKPNSLMDWLAIAGLMCLVYMVIVLLWIICISGIVNGHFVATVACFMFVFFLVYIPTIAFLWYKGIEQRDELIRKYIQDKLKENAVEIGQRV